MLLPVIDEYNADEVALQERQQLPDKTWRITGDRMAGFADELEAVKQAAWKRLNTEAGKYDIYDTSYGLKTVDLIGMEVDYALGELHQRIRASLLRDDRITDATGFVDAINKRKVTVTFKVTSIHGEFEMQTEVQI